MLDLRVLQQNPELVAEALRRRNSNIKIEEFIQIDEQRRKITTELETLKAERNTTSNLIAQLKREGKDGSEHIAAMGSVNAKIKELEEVYSEIQEKQQSWMLNIPNIPDNSVPYGKDENDNALLHTHGTKPEFSFQAKEHWELVAQLEGLDFERGARLAGSRFTVYWSWAARLERALINFFLDVHTKEHGYCEVYPPLMVNEATMTSTGHLPKFKEDLFKIEGWDFYLIPTSEVPLTAMFSGEVLAEDELSFGMTAQTPCFRSEAGAYGKDTKGLIRQHQFNKVEMVRICHPDESYNELEKMRGHAETLLQRLGLAYRTVTLCTGDMGFSSSKTYDIEVWLPGQQRYREISSCSNCLDFQARRANIKFKPNDGSKARFVHTLNGSGLAVGRTLVAIVENGQREDGSVVIPPALVPYMGGVECILPKKDRR